MTLVSTRAAFEKAVTDAVAAVDSAVLMVYDNVAFTRPGKTKKYILMTVAFGQSTLQNQGAAQDYYAGTIQCNVYVPKSAGTAVLSAISEAVIDGLTSVNASSYVDTYSASPRVMDVVGPTPIDVEDRSHFIGVISCQFTATA
jgi:hypothetical protein